MEFEPLVSVIMPVRNREHSIARAIDGVLGQTYRRFELIVVDDGSTDRTADVAASYGSALTLVRRDAEGVYPARNFGLTLAAGELIAFADSDDCWLPHKLASQVPLLGRPETGLVFGDTIHFSASRDGAETGATGFRASPPSRGRVAAALAWRNFVPTCTVLTRRSCLEEIGGFDTSSQLSADYLAWFRIALRHELDFVDDPVCLYTFSPDSMSFDSARSVAARMTLFADELDRTRDPAVRAMLRRLLFNLSLHLAAACVRGRARSVERPLRRAWTTALKAAGPRAAPWTAAFLGHQLWLRARRFAR